MLPVPSHGATDATLRPGDTIMRWTSDRLDSLSPDLARVVERRLALPVLDRERATDAIA